MIITIKNLFPQFLKNYYHLVNAFLANCYYRFPSRKLIVIGVTGTDGKTTTCNLIYHLLKQSKEKVSLVSSINAILGTEKYDTGLHTTTPNPWQLQKFLRLAVKNSSNYLVLETTSHAIDQYRNWGIKYEIAVLTNVTSEHLDYHKKYSRYLKVKSRLLKKARIAIVNADDSSYEKLQEMKWRKKKLITYSLKNPADIEAQKVSYTKNQTQFTLAYDQANLINKTEHKTLTKKKILQFNFESPLMGDYNLENALAALSACLCLGKKPLELIPTLKSFNPKIVIGRLEKVDSGSDFDIYIDFAHTPGAFSKMLPLLRTISSGKIIHVFGAAGLRDQQKRPMMGEISGQNCDYIILTAEDPRSEKLSDIIDQIAVGCEKSGFQEFNPRNTKYPMKSYFKIEDREKAIFFAIEKLAAKGDLVIITGKSHEKSMCFGNEEKPWSDFEAVKKALH